MRRRTPSLGVILLLAACAGPASIPPAPSSAGSPGAAASPACVADADCAALVSDAPCFAPVCASGRCQRAPRPAGFVLPDGVAHDCKQRVCGAEGAVEERPDPGDAPPPSRACAAVRCTPTGPVEAITPGAACDGAGTCTREGACAHVEQVAVGDNHGCALLRGGEVRCFGWDESGQLSGVHATRLDRNSEPAPLRAPAVRIAANDDQSCAILRDGAVACWGGGDAFRLRPGKDGLDAVRIEGVRDATQIGASRHQTCALHEGGVISCWGTRKPNAVLVARPRGKVAELVVGANGVCGLLDDHRVQCFRTRFEETPSARSLMPEAAALRGVVSLALGRSHACAVLEGGAVECWGNNMDGPVDPKHPTRNNDWVPPVRIADLPPARSVATSFRQTCAVLADGRVICWGMPWDGEGRGRLRELPLRAVTVGMAYEWGCALTPTGGVMCVGSTGLGLSSSHEYRPDVPPWPVLF